MKKFFLLAAMAGVALTGCVKTESEVAVKSDSNRIVFDNPVVSSVTRALIDGTEYPTDVPFSVYAQYKNDNTGENLLYMDNVTTEYVTSTPGTNQESWVPEGNYYWPKQGDLSFAAYSPAAAQDAFTSVAWTDAAGFTFTGFNAVTNNDATKLYDLMYSDYVARQTQANENDHDRYYGIQLIFRHALSALVFNAKTEEDYGADAVIKITNIEVLNPVGSGDLSVTNGTGSRANWTPGADVASMAVTGVTGATQLTNTEVPQGNEMLMVPQTFDGDVKVKITYTMQMATSAAPVTHTYEVALNTLNESDGASSTTHDGWDASRRYTYNIIIGLDRIYFAPTVTDWEDITVTGTIE